MIFAASLLAFPGAVESSHMGHPDFRVQGKIFARLRYPDESWGMVKLSPDEQQTFIEAQPEVFLPVKGAWGGQGSTNVRLEAVDASALSHALGIAWQAASVKRSEKPRDLRKHR
jgi:hypothetical protein